MLTRLGVKVLFLFSRSLTEGIFSLVFLKTGWSSSEILFTMARRISCGGNVAKQRCDDFLVFYGWPLALSAPAMPSKPRRAKEASICSWKRESSSLQLPWERPKKRRGLYFKTGQRLPMKTDKVSIQSDKNRYEVARLKVIRKFVQKSVDSTLIEIESVIATCRA